MVTDVEPQGVFERRQSLWLSREDFEKELQAMVARRQVPVLACACGTEDADLAGGVAQVYEQYRAPCGRCRQACKLLRPQAALPEKR